MIQNLTQFPTLNKLKNLIFQSAMLFLLVFGLGEKLTAQTNPTAQALPYTQNFGTTTFTTIPTGMAAWNGLSGAAISTQALAEASAPTGNATIATATASTTTGGSYGYMTGANARYYHQGSSNATSGVNQLAFAITTGTSTAVNISYKLEVINIGVTTAQLGSELQYRAGTTGTWTNVAGTVNVFGSGGITAVAGNTYTINASVSGLTASTAYQFRFIHWRTTGTSLGIAYDDISVTGVAAGSNPVISSSTATQNTIVLSAYAGYTITASNTPTSILQQVCLLVYLLIHLQVLFLERLPQVLLVLILLLLQLQMAQEVVQLLFY